MSELAATLRRAREFAVPVGKFTFRARRPTDVEAVEIHQKNRNFQEIAEAFVVGWDPIPRNEIAGDGSSDLVAFDADTWREWCADRPDFWKPIALAVLEAYEAHAAKAIDVPKA